MFESFLFSLREQGLPVGLGEWNAFLASLQRGLASGVDELYHVGRAILVHTEAHYDLYDVAFARSFRGLTANPTLQKALDAWLKSPAEFDASRARGEHTFKDMEEMLEALRKTMEEQRGRHEGGNRWVGTGGTSPWGTGGQSREGIQLGEGEGNGGRSGVRLAEERRWKNYRTDHVLEIRDFALALRALRKLAKEGEEHLDVDETIDETARNAGEIELVMAREKKNRVKVVLLMDSGGSMYPHAELASRLFTAAKAAKGFKTFQHYYFHNCVYQHLWTDYETNDRVETAHVLNHLDAEHRLIFVGDASMAPWELFTRSAVLGTPAPSGLERLRMFREKSPAAVWLNPDPRRFWDHPTVSAIGSVFPMHELSLDGLRAAIRKLRSPI